MSTRRADPAARRNSSPLFAGHSTSVEHAKAAVVRVPNLSTGPITSNFTVGYAKGVGVINQRIIVDGQVTLRMELKEYRPPKK